MQAFLHNHIMRLFLLPQTFHGQNTIEISGKDFNYLTRALRLKVGQEIMGRDREGTLWDLTIASIGRTTCILTATLATQAIERTDALPESQNLKPIILYQCLPKGRKADDIIKKGTEAGVRDIVLVKSKNCITDLNGKELQRLSRYDQIVAEAIQQSGSLVPTKVDGIIDLKDIPSDFEKRSQGTSRLGLVLHQSSIEGQNKDLLQCALGFEGTVALVVGPEGGLDDSECQLLISAGFEAILLKTNILRCETASIYAIGALQTILQTTCQ